MTKTNASEEAYLRALRYRFPDVGAALAEIAHLRSVLALPRGTIHVVSDVHGENKKLEHVLRNGSGSLRKLVDSTLGEGPAALAEHDKTLLLNLIYYPRETLTEVTASLDATARRAIVRKALGWKLTLLRKLATRYSLRHTERLLPAAFAPVFRELIVAEVLGRDEAFVDALIAPFVDDDGGVELLRGAAHALRSLSSHELIVAGDLGDRGPRIDKVIDALRHQANVRITWGNHDAEWMGACLGQPALVASVLRISLRYGRLAQIEEGYGIPVEPIEQLAHAAYGDDPAEHFAPKGSDLRDPLLLARMQKALLILQLKLDAQTAARNPGFSLDHRNLLDRIDPVAGTVTVDGVTYPLLDTRFPTVDWNDPYKLSAAEQTCIDLMVRAFVGSPSLWRDMQFVAEHGGMWTRRDELLIFHGCVPVEADGTPRSFDVDGTPYAGRALFDALEGVVRRAFRERRTADLDLLYYLWTGPCSPLFGKDRMATFEGHFVADKRTHKEQKDPYFSLIHEAPFCERIAREFEVAEPSRVLLVNGHVPVKLEEGESPLKKSGLAVTIDGAFSEAYGDHGYTLVMDAGRTYLAKHHHFESVEKAIRDGADIVPELTELRGYEKPRTVADSDVGEVVRQEIAGLQRLAAAYRNRELPTPFRG